LFIDLGISLRYQWKQIKEAWDEDSDMLQHLVFLRGRNGNNGSGAGFKSTAEGSSAKNHRSEFSLSSNQLFA
jgi:hypothetical protein